jgi:3-oxoacyl-[acyl-carrier protein] reductase/meso-butanediol dehydrogenase/(S,S)-butanediol dehydrogenase/diacetyl reductase
MAGLAVRQFEYFLLFGMFSMKSIVISGASAGIGKAIAELFLDKGFKVFTISRQPIDRPHPNQIHIVRDLGNWGQCMEIGDIVSFHGSNVDILINNVGRSEWRALHNVDADFFQSMIAINVTSCVALTKALLPLFSQNASIVNISSMAGKRGTKNNSVYCASKFAMNGLTQSWAKEFGPKGIRVNAICPVLIDTDGLADALRLPDSPAYESGSDLFVSDFIRSQSALGKLPSAHDVADLCFYLSSENSSSITGQCINLDCGVFPQ